MLLLVVGCEQILYDKFCQRLGFNESNGHKDISEDSSQQKIRIKCDGKIQINWDCYRSMGCKEYDEYGACVYKGNELKCFSIKEGYMWITQEN